MGSPSGDRYRPAARTLTWRIDRSYRGCRENYWADGSGNRVDVAGPRTPADSAEEPVRLLLLLLMTLGPVHLLTPDTFIIAFEVFHG